MTNRAWASLHDVLTYIALDCDNPERAKRVRDGYMKTFDSLQWMPHAHLLHPDSGLSKLGVRYAALPNPDSGCIALFQIDDDQGLVSIIDALTTKQDASKRL